MQALGFDVARVRGLYPTVGAGTAYLEGAFAALQPESVIRAVITALRAAPAQPGSVSPRSRRSAASFQQAREAVADLVGARAEDVVLAGSTPMLAQHLVWRLSRNWQLSDEIVLSRFDHDAVTVPVLAAAKQAGAIVRWAEVDVETGDLPSWQYRELIGARTRLVSLPLASPVTGAVPDVVTIAAQAREAGALVLADGSAAAVHCPIDIGSMGIDLLLMSAASFGGPTLGLLAAGPGVYRRMDKRRARASGKAAERHRAAVRAGSDVDGGYQAAIAPGGLPIELMDGLTAAIDHLAGLDDEAAGSRRERLISSIEQAGAHQAALGLRLRDGLSALPGVTLLGRPDPAVAAVGLTVGSLRPEQVGEQLLERGISVWTGLGGYSQLMAALGVDELGGAVLMGAMPHTSRVEIDRAIAAIAQL